MPQSDRITKLYDEIISESTQELQTELADTKKQLTQMTEKYSQVTEKFKKLKSTVNSYESFQEFISLINDDNFDTILSVLDLKHNNFNINGMHVEDIPKWFKRLFHYYEDREKLFGLMDLVNIKYPAWAKNYKMPYDYSEEELEIFVDHISDHYVCNGCIFDSNVGFFWESLKPCRGDTHKILTKGTYTEIPWQLVLSNPLWSNENLFSKVIDCVKANKSNSDYFFTIQKYTKISDEQANEMFKILPMNNLWDVHKIFMENNIHLVKGTPIFTEKFGHKICGDFYSTYYYLNYPLEIQKDFIRNHSDFNLQRVLISRMKISKEDKMIFATELLEKTFN